MEFLSYAICGTCSSLYTSGDGGATLGMVGHFGDGGATF